MNYEKEITEHQLELAVNTIYLYMRQQNNPSYCSFGNNLRWTNFEGRTYINLPYSDN